MYTRKGFENKTAQAGRDFDDDFHAHNAMKRKPKAEPVAGPTPEPAPDPKPNPDPTGDGDIDFIKHGQLLYEKEFYKTSTGIGKVEFGGKIGFSSGGEIEVGENTVFTPIVIEHEPSTWIDGWSAQIMEIETELHDFDHGIAAKMSFGGPKFDIENIDVEDEAQMADFELQVASVGFKISGEWSLQDYENAMAENHPLAKWLSEIKISVSDDNGNTSTKNFADVLSLGYKLGIDIEGSYSVNAADLLKLKAMQVVRKKLLERNRELAKVTDELDELEKKDRLKRREYLKDKEDKWREKKPKKRKNKSPKSKKLERWNEKYEKTDGHQSRQKKIKELKKKADDLAKKLRKGLGKLDKLSSKMSSKWGKKVGKKVVKFAGKAVFKVLGRLFIILGIIETVLDVIKVIRYWDYIEWGGDGASLDDAPLFGEVPEAPENRELLQPSEDGTVGNGGTDFENQSQEQVSDMNPDTISGEGDVGSSGDIETEGGSDGSNAVESDIDDNVTSDMEDAESVQSYSVGSGGTISEEAVDTEFLAEVWGDFLALPEYVRNFYHDMFESYGMTEVKTDELIEFMELMENATEDDIEEYEDLFRNSPGLSFQEIMDLIRENQEKEGEGTEENGGGSGVQVTKEGPEMETDEGAQGAEESETTEEGEGEKSNGNTTGIDSNYDGKSVKVVLNKLDSTPKKYYRIPGIRFGPMWPDRKASVHHAVHPGQGQLHNKTGKHPTLGTFFIENLQVTYVDETRVQCGSSTTAGYIFKYLEDYELRFPNGEIHHLRKGSTFTAFFCDPYQFFDQDIE